MPCNLRTLLTLIAVCLLSAGCARPVPWHGRRQPAGGQGELKVDAVKAEPAAPRKLREGNDPPWDVRGWGQTTDDAEKDARAKAAKKVTDYLRRQQPPILWTVTADYVRDHLQTAPPERYAKDDQDLKEAGKVKCWTIPVRVTPDDLTAMAWLAQQEQREQARLHRAAVSRERMAILGRALVSLLAVVVALGTYLRLSSWTKGHHARWLAVAAASVAAVVGLGVWIH
jgi:hypothetical protein